MFTGTVNLAKDYYITNVNALQKKFKCLIFYTSFFLNMHLAGAGRTTVECTVTSDYFNMDINSMLWSNLECEGEK